MRGLGVLSSRGPGRGVAALVGVAAGLALTCGEGEPYGVVIDGEVIPVIDMHLHPGDWDSIPPATQAFLAERFPFPFKVNPGKVAAGILSPAGIVEELDAAGIHAGVLFAVYAPQTVGIATNELVLRGVQDFPYRLRGLASLRVDRWGEDAEEELARLDEALSRPGMIGVKLAHAHMHFRMDDPAYFGIYEVAARRGKAVYLHTGTSPFPGIAVEPPYTDPRYMEAAIAAYPQVIFILGHLGYDFIRKEIGDLDACIDLARRYPNVYLEPSAFGSEGGDPTGANLLESMRRIKEAGVVDRVIYGSDGPQSPGFVASYLERTVTAMKGADYDAEEIRAVLSGNFVRVFGQEGLVR